MSPSNTAQQPQSSAASIFGADSSIIIWVILGVLVALLGIYFVYSWIKERIKNKKNKLAAAQLEKNSIIYWYELAIKIDYLIKLNREEQDKFIVSIGKLKMRDLNNAAKETINEIMSSYEFKNYISTNQKYSEFVNNLVILKDLNSNLWDKKLSNSVINFFINQIEPAYLEAKKAITTELNDLKEQNDLKNEIQKQYFDKFPKDIKGDENEENK
ncbi:hypothetical protein RRG39_02680 [Mycoplasmopsis cynos]|uniref:MHJ_0274 family protein n=1 Tax=Mycoplasmopsis cynos TaxID=171284 RepID=UPI002AFF8C2B|nr:hypothetical protein [Mycoplasmopsis cynos]WQQ16658.1 hypothetical protein RRG39_02680 [Mycoplasmopsis cynos]